MGVRGATPVELLTSLFEEECCLIGNQVTSKVLRSIDEAGDNGPPEISALDQIGEGRVSAHFGLDFDSAFHHSDGVIDVFLRLASKADDRFAGFFDAAATDEPVVENSNDQFPSSNRREEAVFSAAYHQGDSGMKKMMIKRGVCGMSAPVICNTWSR